MRKEKAALILEKRNAQASIAELEQKMMRVAQVRITLVDMSLHYLVTDIFFI